MIPLRILMPVFLFLTQAEAADKTFVFIPYGADFIVFGKNGDSLVINQARITELKLRGHLARLASLKRINIASDDPAAFAVAEKMEAMLKQIRQGSMNDEDMRDLHYFVESVITEDRELLKKIRLLLVQSSGGILSEDDREIIQTEISQLLSRVNMNAKFAQFNTQNVIPELTTTNLDLDRIDAVHNVQGSIAIVDETLKILTVKSVLQGIKSNILTFRIEGKNYHFFNLQKAQSSITGIDISDGISELIRDSILFKTQNGILLRQK